MAKEMKFCDMDFVMIDYVLSVGVIVLAFFVLTSINGLMNFFL